MLGAELLSNELGILHYAVGAKVAEVIRLLNGGHLGQHMGVNGARHASATLIEQQYSELLQRPLEPATVGGRTRRAKPRPPL